MLFNQHSLRSAPIEMQSLFSALRGSGKQIQMQLCAELCALRGAGLCQALHCMAGFLAVWCWLASSHSVSSSCSSKRRALRARGAPRRSQSVGAAGSGRQILSVRLRALPEVAKSRLFSFPNTGPCQSVLPNPSINRTASGSRLSQTLGLTGATCGLPSVKTAKPIAVPRFRLGQQKHARLRANPDWCLWQYPAVCTHLLPLAPTCR